MRVAGKKLKLPRPFASDAPAGPAASIDRQCAELRAQLGEGTYQWLCACAVYPGLRWPLTVYLGRILAESMGREPPDEVGHLALARLPWFRKGQMPDELRLCLLADLTPENRLIVREALERLFFNLLDHKLPPGDRYEELDIARPQPPGWRGRLHGWFDSADATRGEPERDLIFAHYMMGRALREVELRLDRRLARLFESRLAGLLDRKTLAAAGLALMASVILWIGGGWILSVFGGAREAQSLYIAIESPEQWIAFALIFAVTLSLTIISGDARKLVLSIARDVCSSILTMRWRSWISRKTVLVISVLILSPGAAAILIAEWFAPYNLHTRHPGFIHSSPQAVHLFHEGRFVGPFVYGVDFKINLQNLKREYILNPDDVQPLRFFCSGDEYLFWGLIPMDFHFVCPAEGGTLFLLGTDRLGRDLFSRITYGARVSLTVGLFGITVSFVLGILLGGVSGYYGGWVDNLVQRTIEVIRSFPELPLWMALSAALPITWDPISIYFGIAIILGLVNWPCLAQTVRANLRPLDEEAHAAAVRLLRGGLSRMRGPRPSRKLTHYATASAILSLGTMIVGETALTFMGLGLRPPITSWGVLLTEAQNINLVALYPWLMLPVVPVILVLLALNLLGHSLREAADDDL